MTISKLKQRIADVLFPGWREDTRITSMLEHQARLRADPERQALNRRLRREQSKVIALGLFASGCVLLALLLGCACWFGQMTVITAFSSPFMRQSAAAIAASALMAFVLIARPWSNR